MKANLSAKVYHSLRKTIDEGTKLDIGVADAVAAAMKDWAVDHLFNASIERNNGVFLSSASPP